MIMFKTLLLLLLLPSATPVSLEQALVDDLFPPSSTQCSGTSGETRYTYDFTSNHATSQWAAMAAPFERDAFLAEFQHIDASVNRSWTLRVGHGGIVTSFVGAYGEAMPPQEHAKAPWIDEVWQMVAVNLAKNDVAAGESYFIHQAGTYQNAADLLEKPFYSPSVAKHCSTDSRQCSFAAWGQQAHTPTIHQSAMIYYTRYKDCGDGVIEVTYAMHNANPSGGDYFDYSNTPWGGVRPSVFRDVLNARADGTGAELIDPLLGWGDSANPNPNIMNLGGYTVFTEGLPKTQTTFEMPCGVEGSTNPVSCDTTGASPIALTISSQACRHSSGHTSSWGLYTVQCYIEPTVELASNGCQSCNLQFTNPRDESIFSYGVLHWTHQGYRMFFWPADATVTEVNAVFQAGDVITVSHWDNGGKPAEDNLALSFVYGNDAHYQDSSSSSWRGRPTRLRTGTTGLSRDYTVFTVS